ncbi:MAG TPA: FAD-dependent oxidoreductase [Bryobacteraceae bacterium]|jgi:glycine/D-amino acid oxidase-like deaminating enzyme|nr:FAD-dependent oxidoreductase [Bryobacteraceae bacterium]
MERDRALTPRRRFLSAGLIGLTAKAGRRVDGSFVNESHALGHRLRDHAAFAAPKRRIRIPLVILGGGMAGLSAAWRLDKSGFRDFVLLEMERQPGGNSRWGENEVSAYPWAAHYVPVPNRKSALVRELFEELGLLTGGKWEERHLCFSPQERLFLHGRWQEELEPAVGATAGDRRQYREFEDRLAQFRASGEFTIPIELGARPSTLDRVSMAEWMRQCKFDSRYLNWYVNYACRDDYGAPASGVSAWAGIHYFASRENEDKGPFTWPEGNGWIARHLLQKLARYVRTGSPVYRIARDARRLRVFTEEIEYSADALIFAAPTFLAPHILENAPPAAGFEYSPWLTANLTLDRIPKERGVEAAWDNVLYDSPALGYVNATHQTLSSHVERTVWTYYWALVQSAPAESRRLLLEKDWSYWKEAILNDLSRAHPDIRQCVSRIDIMRMGHAMIRPAVGFLFSEGRRQIAGHHKGNLWFANSDVSGISIFEEAQYRGVKAAEAALRRLG